MQSGWVRLAERAGWWREDVFRIVAVDNGYRVRYEDSLQYFHHYGNWIWKELFKKIEIHKY